MDEFDDDEPEVAREPSAKNKKREFCCINPHCPTEKNKEGNGYVTRRNVIKHTFEAKKGVECGVYVSNLSPSDSILSDFIKVIYNDNNDKYQQSLLDFTARN